MPGRSSPQIAAGMDTRFLSAANLLRMQKGSNVGVAGIGSLRDTMARRWLLASAVFLHT